MTKEDYDKFAKVMAALAYNFDSECPPEKVSVYYAFLSDLSIEQIKKAAEKIIKTADYHKFPPVGVIRKAVLGSDEDRAILAWKKVYDAIVVVGYGRSIKFDDPVIHSVIETMGGWEYMCLLKANELDWKRKEFIETYKAFANKPDMKHPEYLIGRHELVNRESGWEVTEPIVEWPPQRKIREKVETKRLTNREIVAERSLK